MKVSFCALGCKVNQYEADAYAKMFRDRNWDIGAFDEICEKDCFETDSTQS